MYFIVNLDVQIGLLQKKNCNTMLNQWKMGWSKSRWNFRGVHQKLRKKHRIPGGQCKKNRYSQQGVQFFPRKAHWPIGPFSCSC